MEIGCYGQHSKIKMFVVDGCYVAWLVEKADVRISELIRFLNNKNSLELRAYFSNLILFDTWYLIAIHLYCFVAVEENFKI